MLVGVLSDTHLHRVDEAERLAAVLLRGAFAEVEAILHAGDVVLPALEDYFYPLPWYGVRGNMDHSLSDLPISRIVTLQEKQIGMIHGWGSGVNFEQRVQAHFADKQLDALVFGHSHAPLCKRVGDLLLFNPGSATDRRSAPEHTVGLLKIEKGQPITGRIIPID
ncbi:metallophosphoesterase family protein [Malonomonas rubra]|uniref:metallophosphoesterase family protein n=1 Tax=Malonomonas rubra TaxID=57040 RepID=UPI000935056F|nr:metallophosphoesterase [Malonomonas rubra]